MAKKKYLRKSEFRVNANPTTLNAKGRAHTAYVSARQGKKYKINMITHASSFFGEPTMPLYQNPQRDSKDPRPSRYSVPRWESESNLKERSRGVWKLHKRDRIAIKKFNKKYK